ncbi:uncharacterized protein LOC129885666 isoform X2 [Solanum dulcamara]|nr:uncharacterized protein LOC129885666 isoform X2 [Solanum dulcamara]XP_055816004.1 uncharacterized protein LOC129885666 isoform X2 [Solanum dulcamara]XP_055816006.1 uncharacterized protein LOC129885666 isoform X2 [Solanum dulcamara]XP_055816007.1 uncharacterized protein LOC129885666 isoform X2 [Solanum dulcamara]
MYKQSPSRNHRSKGVKVKNVLQICLLLAVCFWLIYQVKHSHDKKKEFDEDDAKSSIKTESSNVHMKLGRKDLLPRIEKLDAVKEKHREEPEDEIVEEEEGNKPEEEDLEENNNKEKNDEHREDVEDEVDDHDQEKNDEHREDREDEVDDHDQEKYDEHREDGEDEVDDHDHEKSDVERDQEEDAVDEDKERGEDNEKETEERDSEVNDSQVEEENSLEDHDHDEDSNGSHEAREEHYKADDASSAVTHDTVVTTTENESGKLEQEAEHVAEAKSEVGVNNIMQINASQNTTVGLNVEDGKADGEDSPPNTTNSEEKHDDPISSTAADTSVSNSTRTEGLTDNSESRNHSTELDTQTHDLFLQNGTQAVNQEYNATVGDTTSGGSNLSISSSQQNSNSADTMDDNQIDSNLRFYSKNDELDSIPVDSSNVSGDTEPSLAEKVIHGNATVEAVDNVELPLKDNNATEVEKVETSSEELGTTDEGGDASIAENLGEVQDDLIDTSDSATHLEEKHIRTDVETLPEIQTEGSMEDAAAE